MVQIKLYHMVFCYIFYVNERLSENPCQASTFFWRDLFNLFGSHMTLWGHGWLWLYMHAAVLKFWAQL